MMRAIATAAIFLTTASALMLGCHKSEKTPAGVGKALAAAFATKPPSSGDAKAALDGFTLPVEFGKHAALWFGSGGRLGECIVLLGDLQCHMTTKALRATDPKKKGGLSQAAMTVACLDARGEALPITHQGNGQGVDWYLDADVDAGAEASLHVLLDWHCLANGGTHLRLDAEP